MLLDRTQSLLLLVDLQERLMPAVTEGERTVANALRLIHAARRLNVPVLASEQYPEGLGPTVPAVRAALEDGEVHRKTTFDGARARGLAEAVAATHRRRIVLAGSEAHVCVLQTAAGFMARGYETAIVADAVASRAAESRRLGLDRLAAAGAQIVTTEMVLFEWIGEAATPEFRDLLELIK